MQPISHVVPFSHGLLWIRLAWRLYRRHPLMWISYTVSIILIGALLAQLPFGAVFFQLIVPAFNGGIMLAGRDARRWQPLTFQHLFSAFKEHGAQLVTIGGIYLVGMLIAFKLPEMLSHDPIIQIIYAGQPSQEAMQQLMHLHLSGPTAILLLASMTLFTVMLMLFWFSPALVVLGKQTAIAAMQQSFFACAKNFPAFLLYGLIMIVLLWLAIIPAALGLFVIIPTSFISYYTAYRDVFYPSHNTARYRHPKAAPR
jgi:uncharacterized membrane protein